MTVSHLSVLLPGSLLVGSASIAAEARSLPVASRVSLVQVR